MNSGHFLKRMELIMMNGMFVTKYMPAPIQGLAGSDVEFHRALPDISARTLSGSQEQSVTP